MDPRGESGGEVKGQHGVVGGGDGEEFGEPQGKEEGAVDGDGALVGGFEVSETGDGLVEGAGDFLATGG